MENIIRIENNNFTKVYADSLETTYTIGDQIFFNITRVKNDVYGNPIYKIIIEDAEGNNINENYRGKAHRTYKKGYSTLQSYNLSNTLENLFS